MGPDSILEMDGVFCDIIMPSVQPESGIYADVALHGSVFYQSAFCALPILSTAATQQPA